MLTCSLLMILKLCVSELSVVSAFAIIFGYFIEVCNGLDNSESFFMELFSKRALGSTIRCVSAKDFGKILVGFTPMSISLLAYWRN